MYNEHFRFSETPFTIAPNPRYLYLSAQHREALAHLDYGVGERGGFILLTGDVGTGKTTVCRCFLGQVPAKTHVALLLNPPLNETELLQAICDEFDIDYPQTANVNQLTALLNQFLLQLYAAGECALIVVEEAQHLDYATLERLRLLTNLETDERKLLQVILIGQPELLEILARPEMSQLAQRVIARHHLRPLNAGELKAYLQHRLKVSGGDIGLFPEAVRLLLFKLSKGVPRLINLICDRALLGCYAQGKTVVDVKTLRNAAREVLGELPPNQARHRRYMGIAASIVVLAAGYYLLHLTGVARVPAAFPMFDAVVDADTAADKTNDGDGTEGKQAVTVDEVNMAATDAPPVDEVVPIVEPAPIKKLTWEDVLRGNFGEGDAYQAVLDTWGIGPVHQGITPCEYANYQGLDCWSGNTPLSIAQRINRPSIIKLLNHEGRPFYIALLTMDDRYANIQAGTQTVRVAYDQLRSVWTGEYTILWRRPLAYADTLKPGYKGPMLSWLSAKLAEVGNTGSQQIDPLGVYDTRIARQVRKIQRECGLLVDGLMGRETLIMLNSLTEDVPLLSKARKRMCGRKLS